MIPFDADCVFNLNIPKHRGVDCQVISLAFDTFTRYSRYFSVTLLRAKVILKFVPSSINNFLGEIGFIVYPHG